MVGGWVADWVVTLCKLNLICRKVQKHADLNTVIMLYKGSPVNLLQEYTVHMAANCLLQTLVTRLLACQFLQPIIQSSLYMHI